MGNFLILRKFFRSAPKCSVLVLFTLRLVIWIREGGIIVGMWYYWVYLPLPPARKFDTNRFRYYHQHNIIRFPPRGKGREASPPFPSLDSSVKVAVLNHLLHLRPVKRTQIKTYCSINISSHKTTSTCTLKNLLVGLCSV